MTLFLSLFVLFTCTRTQLSTHTLTYTLTQTHNIQNLLYTLILCFFNFSFLKNYISLLCFFNSIDTNLNCNYKFKTKLQRYFLKPKLTKHPVNCHSTFQIKQENNKDILHKDFINVQDESDHINKNFILSKGFCRIQ